MDQRDPRGFRQAMQLIPYLTQEIGQATPLEYPWTLATLLEYCGHQLCHWRSLDIGHIAGVLRTSAVPLEKPGHWPRRWITAGAAAGLDKILWTKYKHTQKKAVTVSCNFDNEAAVQRALAYASHRLGGNRLTVSATQADHTHHRSCGQVDPDPRASYQKAKAAALEEEEAVKQADYDRLMHTLLQCSSVKAMAVQDPFVLSHNIALNVNGRTKDLLAHEIRVAANKESEAAFVEKQSKGGSGGAGNAGGGDQIVEKISHITVVLLIVILAWVVVQLVLVMQ
nr:hypothetical protein BaRGS_025230 [Batillaria attramentaria]